MANFFEEKVIKLVDRTGLGPIKPPSTVADPLDEPILDKKIVDEIIKNSKRKKSSGIDGIPTVVVIDTYPTLADAYLYLFKICIKHGMPRIWKKNIGTSSTQKRL